jgi:heat shock protein HtpX
MDGAGGTLSPLWWALTLAALPTVMTLLQLALSRSREYDADLEAAVLTGDPEGLARALEQLERSDSRIWERIMVPHRRAPDPLLLRTHPPTEDRARRLRQLVFSNQGTPLGNHHLVSPNGYSPVVRPARLRAPGIRW